MLHDYARDGGALWLARRATTLDAGTLDEIVGDSGPAHRGGRRRAPSRRRCRRSTRAIRSSRRSATPPPASAGRGSRARCGSCPARAGGSWPASPTASPALVEQPVGTGRIVVFASALGSEDATAWNTFARQADVRAVRARDAALPGRAGGAGAAGRARSSPTRPTRRAAARRRACRRSAAAGGRQRRPARVRAPRA